MKILILASNPRKDLNLDREIRDLKEVIEKSRNREQFEVVIELAVRIEDLQDLMLRHEPQIVHFCGHGGGEEGLLFESDEVKEQLLQTQALSNLFGLCAEHLDCVLLNACYSEVQANEMIEHINYVIGMSQTIQDNASIAFSKGFYRALGYARPIEEAYKFGCNAIQLEITGSSKVRSATETERKLEVVDVIQNKVIPEHLKPILKKKRTLSISAPAPALPQETQTAIRLEIAESLTENSSSDQYRAKVREFLNDRKLSALETIRLEQLRKDLRLSEEEASQNLVEELEPVQKGRDEYKAMLIGLIEKGLYPLDAETEAELLAVQQELGLTDEEVAAIATPILAAAEESKAEAVGQIFAEVGYSTLRDLLVARRWQEADQETFKVMLKIIGTTHNLITDNKIATFPRKDLHMIDQLWNQSSNGLFGFSIQKRVWLSVGGKAGKHDFKIYDDFGERLGWRLNNEWVNYENLTFSLDAPEGHLPVCGYATDNSWIGWYWALFSRRDW